MNPKTKRIVTIVAIAIPSLMAIISAAFKFSGQQMMLDHISQLGLPGYLRYLGLAELLFTCLFIYNKTFKLGLLLLTGYFGGALATELSHGGPYGSIVVILALFWTAALIRDRSTFLISDNAVKSSTI
jgi:hypothetical protein